MIERYLEENCREKEPIRCLFPPGKEVLYTLLSIFFLSGSLDLDLKKTIIKKTKKEMKISRICLHLRFGSRISRLKKKMG